ncbi:MAG: 2-dehydropantoate 2-reductase [Motiliproteus sp.]|jgi:2-dehydropantoate 2-reductase
MITPPPEPWHILGAGAIGSLWACYLRLAGQQPRLILRSAESLRRFDGSLLLSHSATRQKVSLTAELADSSQPIQRLLLTTKSYDARAAVESVRHRLNHTSLVVVLQNGMGQQQQLAERFPDIAFYAGTTTEGAYLKSTEPQPLAERLPNIGLDDAGTTAEDVYRSDTGPAQQLVHAGRGASWLGPINARACDRGSAVLDSLLQLPLTTGYDAQIQDRLWHKLAINAAINGLTAIHDCQNGQLALNPDYREQMRQLCDEVEQLARALQQPLFDRPLLEIALEVATATASNYSSMLQDVRKRRHTEIRFINGYICRQADRLGIDTPHNQALVDHISSLYPHSAINNL